MQRIINLVLFDTEKATEICKVSNTLGAETRLMRTKARNHFLFCPDDIDEKIKPLSQEQTMEWLDLNSTNIQNISDVLEKCFDLKKPKTENPLPKSALKVMSGLLNLESLYKTDRGVFFLKDNISGEHRKIAEQQALQFIEQNQDEISEQELKKILKNHFPTIKTA